MGSKPQRHEAHQEKRQYGVCLDNVQDSLVARQKPLAALAALAGEPLLSKKADRARLPRRLLGDVSKSLSCARAISAMAHRLRH